MSAQQNLIYNGDFEIYDTCPVNISTPGDLQIEHCIGWTSPTKLGTSDYFNVCNNLTSSHFVGVPANMLGFQYPYNGDGYSGILSWMVSTNGINYREYIQTKLLKKLEVGKSYNVAFNVAFSGSGYAIEKIGALLSANSYSANTWQPLAVTPQVINDSGILSDSLNWTKVEGIFEAIGNEEYLTIGYFVDSLNVMDTVNIYNDPFTTYFSYYYIDRISLVELPCNNAIPNIYTPNNDGINDIFKIKICDTTNFNLTIYNRWGIKIFETTNHNQGWDGRTTSGEECMDGNYFYVLETKEKKIKGFVQLIR
jgi:gliding motility-associated-like protein